MEYLDKRFSYLHAITNRLDIPSVYIPVNGKKVKFELLVSNGYVKFYTYKGRMYHVQQNRLQHLSSDWKFHFNVCEEDIPKAWQIITKILLNYTLKYVDNKTFDDLFLSMKAINTNLQKKWPKYMFGREITVYIYQYIKELNETEKGVEITGDNNEKKYLFYKKDEEQNFNFWLNFLIDCEKELSSSNIRFKKLDGAADGDLYIGKYASLRNESFTYDKNNDTQEYPTNDKGWNYNKQKMPFSWFEIFKLRQQLRNEENIYIKLYEKKYMILSLAMLIFFILLNKYINFII